MTQNNPISSKEETMVDEKNQAGQVDFDEQTIRSATWGAGLLTLAGFLFVIVGFVIAEIDNWQTVVLLAAPAVLFIAGLAALFFLRRGRIILGTNIVFLANLIMPATVISLQYGVGWAVLLYSLVSSSMLIWRTLPRQSRRWATIVAAVSLVAMAIVEVIDSSIRVKPAEELLVVIVVATSLLALTFIVQSIRTAWSRSFTISRKLLIAFGLMFGISLIAVGTGQYGLNNVQTIYEETLSGGIAMQVAADRLDISLLEARRREKDFLLRWQEQGFDVAYQNYVVANHDHIADMKTELNALATLSYVIESAELSDYSKGQYQADLAELASLIDGYKITYTNTVDLLGQRGYVDTGLEGELRDAAHKIEDHVLNVEDSLTITMLEIRRREKDYLLRGEQKYVDNVHELITRLKSETRSSENLSSIQKAEIIALANSYQVSFDALVENDREIATAIEKFRSAAHASAETAAALEITGQEVAAISVQNAETAVSNTAIFTGVTIVLALISAIALAFVFSRQISEPVSQLTDTASEIASGNFDVQAEVTSTDEIGTLAQTFNTMTERLGRAFDDVRRRGLQVQTAADVSRRLSAVTDPRQLAMEVVEQVQRAFDYYYAQIYLLDETGENLVLTGGTGDAGAAMMARGHSLLKGRGLVGRAADTNASVLIPDVSLEEGWLPNELLPDTKTEAAVPISTGNQVLGVLDVQHSEVNGLTVDDVTLLESLAGQAAISLQNARSYEESRKQAELESLVNVIGQKIQRTTTMEETLQTAIRELGTAIGASRVRAKLAPASEDVATQPIAPPEPPIEAVSGQEATSNVKTMPND